MYFRWGDSDEMQQDLGGEALQCIGGSDVLWNCVVKLWSESAVVLELYMPMVLLKLPRIWHL